MKEQDDQLSLVYARKAEDNVDSENSVQRLFTITVNKPPSWFETFTEVQQGELPRRGFTVGRVEFNDDVASDLRCAVKVTGQEKDQSVSFGLEAKIDYSPERIEKDGGFHPVGDTVKIAKRLREQGVKVKFHVVANGQQVMMLEKDGKKCAVNLGWASQKEMPKPSPDSGPNEFGRFLAIARMPRYGSADMSPYEKETASQNNIPVEFRLLPTEEGEFVSKAQRPDQLVGQVSGFSEMLGDFVSAYYQVRDTAPQTSELTIGIPNWETYTSDDADLAATDAFDPEAINRMGMFGREQEIGYFLTEDEKAAMPRFEEIGGQPKAVEEARRLVMAIKHADIFAKRGVDRPRGILLKGPPGTGKTMLAKAIARESGAEFISLSVTDLVSKWFGEAEQKVQGFFDRAKEMSKQGKDVIAFIDEIDSVVPQRDGVHEATQKMVAVFLQNMDGLKSNPRLTVLAATNQAEKIDPAFLRPGRLDKKIEVGIPDALGRAQILNIHLKQHLARAADPDNLLAQGLNVDMVANALGNVSGADIAAIVNLALEEKATAEIRYLEGVEGGQSWIPVSADDLIRAKEKYMPAQAKRKMGY